MSYFPSFSAIGILTHTSSTFIDPGRPYIGYVSSSMHEISILLTSPSPTKVTSLPLSE